MVARPYAVATDPADAPRASARFGNFWDVPPDRSCTGWMGSGVGWETRYRRKIAAPVDAGRGGTPPDRAAVPSAARAGRLGRPHSAAARSAARPSRRAG